MFTVRDAEIEDAQRLLEIYSWYVVNTAVSFDYDPPSLEEYRQKIIDVKQKYPFLVQNPFVCCNCCATPIDFFQIGIDLGFIEEHHLANYFFGSAFTFRAKLILLQNFELLFQPVVDVGKLLNLLLHAGIFRTRDGNGLRGSCYGSRIVFHALMIPHSKEKRYFCLVCTSS